MKIYFFRNPDTIKIKESVVIFFPILPNTFFCGISGIIYFRKKEKLSEIDLDKQENLKKNIKAFKSDSFFLSAFLNKKYAKKIKTTVQEIKNSIEKLTSLDSKTIQKKETSKDIVGCLEGEVIQNISKVKELGCNLKSDHSKIILFKKINTVLNSIDRLEVRGRDSAGISILIKFKTQEYEKIEKLLNNNLKIRLYQRTDDTLFLNNSILLKKVKDSTFISFTYKIAKEIGKLGDNIAFLRNEIKNDTIFQSITTLNFETANIISHTRWASVGEISEPNCHPVNSVTKNSFNDDIIQICLNGDIDNFNELKEEYENSFDEVEKEITTDAKIVSLQIKNYINQGHSIKKAFIMAVNDFEGSHAIIMQTSLCPDKLFLAQKGSGQTIFVGISKDSYIVASEIYGIVEETSSYVKINETSENNGEVFILDANSKKGNVEGIEAYSYEGKQRKLTKKDIKETEINSRDIDRQSYPHYFLKEINEAPDSIEKTISGRYKVVNKKYYEPSLDETIIPKKIKKEFISGKINKIICIGQGTAAIASKAMANIASYYFQNTKIQIKSGTATELSSLISTTIKTDLKDTLIVAVTQSGTTTDTNRTIDMAKEKGAKSIAIVNKRDSDITFKTDGVLYTSTGRDIEMSVASTKAFYSQIVAGTMLFLELALIKKVQSQTFINQELKELLKLPEKMKKVFKLKDGIKNIAQKTVAKNNYWAVVGSNYNKASADEIRIKLSELCYRTISSDIIEDKKHIDLSAEPLIIVCATGLEKNIISDVVKEIKIFKAHKATPVIFTDAKDKLFKPFEKSTFYLPETKRHFSPILSTLAGHLFGYYAALTINENSEVLAKCKGKIVRIIENNRKKGLDNYELLFEKKFQEEIATTYEVFTKRRREKLFPNIMSFNDGINLALILKYLSGRLPISDFKLDFDAEGTPEALFLRLNKYLNKIIESLSRPIDAIKHQAKTVTVGTSREVSKVSGIIFDIIEKEKINTFQITNRNIIVLKNLQSVVEKINGFMFYNIKGLNNLGKQTKNTKISVIKKAGNLKELTSRVEKDNKLKGTKSIIVREGNVFVGSGMKYNNRILIVPVLSHKKDKVNVIEKILLFNISFKDKAPLFEKIKALGGKYQRMKDIVQEKNIVWKDSFLDKLSIDDMFSKPAEKSAELIEKLVK